MVGGCRIVGHEEGVALLPGGGIGGIAVGAQHLPELHRRAVRAAEAEGDIRQSVPGADVGLEHGEQPRLHIQVAEGNGLDSQVRHIVRIGVCRGRGGGAVHPPGCLRAVLHLHAVGMVPFYIVGKHIAVLGDGVGTPLARRHRPDVGVGRRVVAFIARLALCRHAVRVGKPQRKVADGRAVLLVLDGDVKVLLRFGDCLGVTRKGLSDGQARRLGDQHAVHMPAIRAFVLQHIPAQLEVLRGDLLVRDDHAVKLDDLVACADGCQHRLLGRDRFDQRALDRHGRCRAKRGIHLIGGVRRGGRRDEHHVAGLGDGIAAEQAGGIDR